MQARSEVGTLCRRNTRDTDPERKDWEEGLESQRAGVGLVDDLVLVGVGGGPGLGPGALLLLARLLAPGLLSRPSRRRLLHLWVAAGAS